MGGREELVTYVKSHPEVLAGVAVLMMTWYVVGRMLARRRGVASLPATPFRQSPARRWASVTSMSAVTAAGLVYAWRADGDVGESALGMYFAALGSGLFWPALAGGTLAPGSVDDGSWRRPTFSWWAIGLGATLASGCVGVTVRAFRASIDDTTEAVSLVIVAFACTGLGLGLAAAGWCLRLPTTRASRPDLRPRRPIGGSHTE